MILGLIYPFKWNQALVPIIPEMIYEVLELITPYIFGFIADDDLQT